ncbi:Zn-ribbon domain-containing OB-fold protein [Rhodococcus globerulus]|uniref:Zn-ribbon domain-containing OB-fold protein n=1 Tax=Rhodococcus globerulus TaxID=33008 RepID=UPI001F42E148|nr:hypothetical protein [Rhodococcus globerulus]MCE4265232.1 hypothetical protein [Rhodococcus globerulus]
MTAGGAIRARDVTRDELLLWRCVPCARLLAPLTATCPSCGQFDLEGVISSGAGSIVSCKGELRSPIRRCGTPVSFTLSIVELDDGPWVYASIEGEISAGESTPVRVQFHSMNTGRAIPGIQDIWSLMRGSEVYSTERIRALLYQCGVLRRRSAISSDAHAMINFAIVWASFGGASAGEVFVKFGIGRGRFLQRLQESLYPKNIDDQHVLATKGHLVAAVMECGSRAGTSPGLL